MRVVLIAGEPVFRMGFRALLQSAGDLELVADAPDARAGFRAIDEEKPDIVVMDIALRGMNGISATREVRCRAPEVRILLLADWPRERDALDGLAAGAHGFAVKTEPVESLLYALRTVARGHAYVAAELRGLNASTLEVHRAKGPSDPLDVLNPLSPREREVLDLVVKGWRNRQIARELCVSVKTVDTHRTRINRKLHCASAADLIRFAADNGLLRRAPSTIAGPEDSNGAHVSLAASAEQQAAY
jgi:two-component system, NarL family, response regulator NreC